MSDHIEDLLSDYMDNELDDLDRQRVEEHLLTCSACSALLSDLSAFKNQVFTAFHAIEAPVGFDDKVMQAISLNPSPEHASTASKWLLVPLVSAFCFIMLVLAAMGPFLFKLGSILLKVTYNLMSVFGDILGSNTYLIVGLTGFSIILIVASSLSLKHLLKPKTYKGANR
ncbi:anti-sigma factor family protein [Paenibacillus plantarum]|nr:zf-HC2 domain-containing protein [Paenibacillus plantarum]